MFSHQVGPILNRHGQVAKQIFGTVVPHKLTYYMVSQACQSLFFLHSSVILFSLTLQDFILCVVGFKNKLVSEMKVAEDNKNWGLFIDSCFTHCQTPFHITWHSPISPRLGDKVRFRSFEPYCNSKATVGFLCLYLD